MMAPQNWNDGTESYNVIHKLEERIRRAQRQLDLAEGACEHDNLDNALDKIRNARLELQGTKVE